MDNRIAAFEDYLINVKKTKENTRLSYLRDLQKYKVFLQSRDVANFESAERRDVEEYQRYMNRMDFKAATISRNIASLRAFYQYLYKQGLVSENITDGLEAPKAEKHTPGVLTVEEVSCLLDQPKGISPKEIRDKAMLELLYGTGIRVSELISLQVSDIDFRTGCLVCNDGDKERVIPFGNKAKKALEKYLGETREGMVTSNEPVLFVNCNGKPMSRQGFWKLIKSYATRAGIESEITPHTLRHSFAAHLIENGADIKSVQEMMGHSDIASTMIYTTMKQNTLRKEYAKAHPRR